MSEIEATRHGFPRGYYAKRLARLTAQRAALLANRDPSMAELVRVETRIIESAIEEHRAKFKAAQTQEA